MYRVNSYSGARVNQRVPSGVNTKNYISPVKNSFPKNKTITSQTKNFEREVERSTDSELVDLQSEATGTVKEARAHTCMLLPNMYVYIGP